MAEFFHWFPYTDDGPDLVPPCGFSIVSQTRNLRSAAHEDIWNFAVLLLSRYTNRGLEVVYSVDTQ